MDALDLFVVYDNPIDFPGQVVVRRQAVTTDGEIVADAMPLWVGRTVEGARRAIAMVPGCRRQRMARHPHDEPRIVEIWL